MLFNSISFALFLPVVFVLYWHVFQRNLKIQNFFIVVASYFFYGWWDWRFLSLIFISTLEDYFVAMKIHNTTNVRKRKLWLLTSIIVNLGILGFFKYYNFFADNFVTAFSLFGINPNITSLKIILPVGISFYTFQTMSYTIDIYRKKLEPTKDFMAFAAFVSFFPLLVAGPIERATNLLSQFFVNRKFDYEKAVDGLRQILWGLFKKMVIADKCALIVNQIFDNYQEQSSGALIIGAIFFAFQIYGDFSGYSDIAIGTARLFGFSPKRNFANPYFSRDIAEFWRRWHISLTTWFRDYIYIPLGGSKVSKSKIVRNTFIIFSISGFWHGANWTFIAWGLFHALLFIPLILTEKHRKYTNTVAENRLLPTFREAGQMLFTFALVTIGWIFFRADSINDAIAYISGIYHFRVSDIPFMNKQILITILLIILMIIIEWIGRNDQHALAKVGKKWKPVFRYVMYYAIVFSIFWFSGNKQTFIYFQF